MALSRMVTVVLALSSTYAYAQAPPPLAAGQPVALTQLPADAFPWAINNRGDIAGHTLGFSDDRQQSLGQELFYWSTETGYVVILPMNTLFAEVNAINERGDVVGGIEGSGNEPSTGFIWNVADGLTRLTGMTWAYDINENGDVAGACPSADDPSINVPCVTSREGALTLLPVPAPFRGGEAYALNDRGDVVGTLLGGAMGQEGVVWRNGVVTLLKRGHADGTVFALAINNSGFIAGYHYGEFTPSYAVIWGPSGRILATGPAGSFLYDVNDQGVAAGTMVVVTDPATGAQQQFGYALTVNGGLTLPDPGGHATASAINAKGQIVGWVVAGTEEEIRPVMWVLTQRHSPPRTH